MTRGEKARSVSMDACYRATTSVNRSRCALFGAALIAGLITASMSHAANGKKPCALLLDRYQAIGKVLEFRIALDCVNGGEVEFPINEPLLIGLTATTSKAREDDRGEIEYDFPVQNVVVLPDTTTVTLIFHAQLADLAGKNQVYAMAWPRSFLQDCAGGRSGCAKYGYALARPAGAAKACMKKDDQSGEMVPSDDFLCTGSKDYRFGFP
jgi:hypothetical protein